MTKVCHLEVCQVSYCIYSNVLHIDYTVESGYCSSVCSISSNYSTVESFNNSETVTLATSGQLLYIIIMLHRLHVDTKSGYRSISPSVCSISSNYSTVESFNNETETLSTSGQTLYIISLV